jgi:hypothetical protein
VFIEHHFCECRRYYFGLICQGLGLLHMQWSVTLQIMFARKARRGFDFVNNITVKEWLDADCTKMAKAA